MHQRIYPPDPALDGIPLFEIRSLSYRYPNGRDALQDIDLKIFRGDRVALVGHNGAGKTTLSKQLNGLYRPTQGEVFYRGDLLTEESIGRVRFEVGVLFQDPDDQLFSNTIDEDVAFGPLNQGLSPEAVEERVRHALQVVGLDELRYKAPHHLSFGQKKRAALATILSMNPEVLVLDEPTANLDSKHEKLFWEIFQDFPGTLIVISHDLAFLFGICERAVVLEQGAIHHDFSMKELVSQTEYLRAHGLHSTFHFSCCRENYENHGEHAHGLPYGQKKPSGRSRPHGAHEGSHGRTAIPVRTDSGNDSDPMKRSGPPPLILLDDYSYRYGDGTWGIRSIALRVQEGESIAVLGENGAGKSTLARCLSGIAAGRGLYAFRGEAVDEKSRKRLWRHMGMVFQNPSDQLFCPSCWEEVAFGPKQMGLDKDEILMRVGEALEAVRLTGYEERVPHHLSAGERKRLAIASVLGMRPEVLILDEPTAHLDPQSEELLVEILKGMNVTKFIITHDLSLALALCHRALVLHRARIIRDYQTDDLDQDDHLISINGLDYAYKNACCEEIMALQVAASKL